MHGGTRPPSGVSRRSGAGPPPAWPATPPPDRRPRPARATPVSSPRDSGCRWRRRPRYRVPKAVGVPGPDPAPRWARWPGWHRRPPGAWTPANRGGASAARAQTGADADRAYARPGPPGIPTRTGWRSAAARRWEPPAYRRRPASDPQTRQSARARNAPNRPPSRLPHHRTPPAPGPGASSWRYHRERQAGHKPPGQAIVDRLGQAVHPGAAQIRPGQGTQTL